MLGIFRGVSAYPIRVDTIGGAQAMHRLREFMRELVSSTIIDALKLVTVPLLVGAITFLASKFTLDILDISGVIFWVIALIVTITAMWIAIYIYEWIRGNRPNFGPIDTNYSYANVTIEMKYIDQDNLIYRKSKELVAKRNNLRSFHDRYHWTGDPDFDFECEDKSHRIIDRGKRSVWRCYEVDFQKTLKRGDKEKVSLVWKLKDKNRNFVPFISSAVDHPAESLTLKLDAQAVKDSVKRVNVEVSPLLGADDPYTTEELEGEEGVYIFTTHHPKFLHHYEMRWIMVD